MSSPVLDQLAQHQFQLLDYVPTLEQARIHACNKRFVLVAGGEQAGKSLLSARELLRRMAGDNAPGLYWLVGAHYDLTRPEFEYLRDDFLKLGVLKDASKRVDPGYLVLHDGTRIETKSAKAPRTIAMRAPDGIVACEAAQMELDVYWRLRGRVAPKRGWLFLSGTFETSLGWYPSLFNEWEWGTTEEQAFSLPSYTNTHLYPSGANDPEILRLKAISSDQYFMERIEGKPCPPKGLVIPEFKPHLHIRELDWNPDEPVQIWQDPGYEYAYAVLATQIIHGQVRVFDEVYERGLIDEQIIEVVVNKPWWKNVQRGVADIYVNQHQARKPIAEVWQEKAGLTLVGQKVPVNEGNERLKSFLRVDPLTNEPKLVIDPSCRGILSELGVVPNPFDGQTRAYRWKLDRGGNVVGDTPEDKWNHSIRACVYGLVDNFGYATVQHRQFIPVKRWGRRR